MYAWLWRRFPGGTATKSLFAVVLLAAVLSLLFFVVFPWVEPRLALNDVTVDSGAITPSAH